MPEVHEIPVTIDIDTFVAALSNIELHHLYDAIDADDFCEYRDCCGLRVDHDV